MMEYVHIWEQAGLVTTFTWIGMDDHIPDRVYALAFTQNKNMLLVTDARHSPACWLPGGGIEDGETPEQALERELIEEANAELISHQKLGIQRTTNTNGYTGYQSFYWCRIFIKSTFEPKHEITERHLVSPNQFLDRLFWGRRDPKAQMLLDEAIKIDTRHRTNSILNKHSK